MGRGYIISSVVFVLAITSVIFVNNILVSQASINQGIENDMRIDAVYNAASDLKSSLAGILEYHFNSMSINPSADGYCAAIMNNFNSPQSRAGYSNLFLGVLGKLNAEYGKMGIGITPESGFEPDVKAKMDKYCEITVTFSQRVTVDATSFFHTFEGGYFGPIKYMVNPDDGKVTRTSN